MRLGFIANYQKNSGAYSTNGEGSNTRVQSSSGVGVGFYAPPINNDSVENLYVVDFYIGMNKGSSKIRTRDYNPNKFDHKLSYRYSDLKYKEPFAQLGMNYYYKDNIALNLGLKARALNMQITSRDYYYDLHPDSGYTIHINNFDYTMLQLYMGISFGIKYIKITGEASLDLSGGAFRRYNYLAPHAAEIGLMVDIGAIVKSVYDKRKSNHR